MTAVLEHSRKGGSHFVVLFVIASYSDENGEWRIDQATLQRKSRLGKRRVQQVLSELIAGGELAVVPGHGRGRTSTYRLQVGPEKGERERTLSAEKGERERILSPEKGERECTVSPEKGERECAVSPEKGERECTLSAEKGERGCTVSPEKGERECTLSLGSFPPIPPLSPVRQKDKEEESFALGLRPLSDQQSAVHRTCLLFAEAGLPLPSPSQVGVWIKAAGGPEPLVARIERLISAGLQTKSSPLAYVHRVLAEEARRGETGARPRQTAGGRAGVDNVRRKQALRLLGKGSE